MIDVVTGADATPPPGAAIERTVAALARDASLEVLPAQLLADPSLASLFAPGTCVHLPSLPRAVFTDTVRACRMLLDARLVPVPHLAPRAVGSRADMRQRLAALRDAGVDRLLLIAGDRARPAGPFAGTPDLLDSGLLLEYGFRRFGVAGHPEGHPTLSATALDEALAAKRDYARSTGSEVWIVTQFAFSSAATVRWLERLNAAPDPLPVRIGLPGPARLGTLIAYAARCGVSASARLLRQRPTAARLLTCWTPDGLLRDLAYHRLATAPFHGIHLFPFGGVARCNRWLQQLGVAPSGTRASAAAGAPPA